jgi:predicted membrane protein
MGDQPRSGQWAGKRRRWFLGLEPIFEAGRKGKRAQTWDVEDELIAVALLGDVTIDLSQASSVPTEIAIDAYAILREVDVLVSAGTHVELSGGVVRGDLRNEAPDVPEDRRERIVHVRGHSLLGDVTVRPAAG